MFGMCTQIERNEKTILLELYGAFICDPNGKERLVGTVVTEMEENSIPEITRVMVLPEYRIKHLASAMMYVRIFTTPKTEVFSGVFVSNSTK